MITIMIYASKVVLEIISRHSLRFERDFGIQVIKILNDVRLSLSRADFVCLSIATHKMCGMDIYVEIDAKSLEQDSSCQLYNDCAAEISEYMMAEIFNNPGSVCITKLELLGYERISSATYKYGIS